MTKVHFVDGENQDNLLLSMNPDRAKIFVTLTQTGARIDELKALPMTQGGGVILVWEDVFCITVERAFRSPMNLLNIWSHDAALIYQHFTAEYCEFVWDERGYCTLENRANYHVGPSLTPRAGEVPTRILGPNHLNAITGFQPR